MPGDIVAVEGNIHRARFRSERVGQPAGEFDSSVGDPQEEQAFRIVVASGNSGSQPLDRGMNLLRTNGLGRGHEARL